MKHANKIIRNIFIISLPILTLIVNSCKKFVHVDPPVTRIATGSVFTSNSSATSAQLAIYIQMTSNAVGGTPFNMARNSGTMADELKNFSPSAASIQTYTNSLVSANYNGCWQDAYKFIYESNSIIENLQNNPRITDVVARQLVGESKFIRAFWHFYLVNQYGDVPLVVSTDYKTNSRLSRAPQASVYRQIIDDLKSAIDLLNTNYVDASDTTITTERVRPNKTTAQAMLARVYLYTNKYDSAEAMATNVIGNGNYSLCPNLSGPVNSVFLKNSNEAIWQLQTNLPSNWNAREGYSFILTGNPAGSGGGSNAQAISTQLLAAFEPGDARQTKWLNTYTVNSTPAAVYYYPYKYKVGVVTPAITSLGNISEYSMVLRLAEQYLIRAEARAQRGNLNDAIDDLNKIRTRASLVPLPYTLTQAQVLAAVLQERRVELFCEWGHRWYDLKRTNNLALVMGSPGNVYNAKGGLGAWSSTKELFPIPFAEITNDPNIIQNPGY